MCNFMEEWFRIFMVFTLWGFGPEMSQEACQLGQEYVAREGAAHFKSFGCGSES